MRRLPKSLLNIKDMMLTVLFVVLFSILFTIIYKPFSASNWLSFSSIREWQSTLKFYSVAVIILVVSKLLLLRLNRINPVTIKGGIFWVVGEFILIAAYYIFLTENDSLGAETPFALLLIKVTFNIGMILIIPYFIIVLHAFNKEMMEKLNRITVPVSQTKYQNEEGKNQIDFYDAGGVLRLTVDINSLYLIESENNYVKIYYMEDERLHKYLLRCKTSVIESTLSGTSMMRCHRSYIVNIQKTIAIKTIHKKTALFLDLDDFKPIPVSNSYNKELKQCISVR